MEKHHAERYEGWGHYVASEATEATQATTYETPGEPLPTRPARDVGSHPLGAGAPSPTAYRAGLVYRVQRARPGVWAGYEGSYSNYSSGYRQHLARREDQATQNAQRAQRTWSIIVAGALSGVLVIMLGLLLAQLQQRSAAAQVVGGATGEQSNNAASLPPAAVKGRIPPDFTLQTLTGETLTLSSLRGKPVWVNFWATWCPPCRAEMPEMQQRYNRYREQGLVIVGVDMAEGIDTVKQYVESNGFDWTFVLDSDNRVASSYFVSGIPTHLFIGRDGVIKAIQVGGIPGNLMDRYLEQIVN